MIGKKLQELEIKTKKKLHGDFFGIYKTAFKGQGIDFTELREYNFGDPIKNIDWNSSAKHNRLYTKLYEQERDLNILFVLDIGQNMYRGTENKQKIDTLEEIFFLISMCAQHTNDNIGSLLFYDNKHIFFDFKKGEENIARTIKEIENIKSKQNSQINNALKYIHKLKIKDSLIFILTDDTDINPLNLSILQSNNDIIFINIFDKYENNLSADVSLLLEDNKGPFASIFPSKKIKKYQTERKTKLKNLKKQVEKLHIDYLSIDNTTDIYGTFYKLFYMRGLYQKK